MSNIHPEFYTDVTFRRGCATKLMLHVWRQTSYSQAQRDIHRIIRLPQRIRGITGSQKQGKLELQNASMI